MHLSGELFKRMAKVELLHVPYRGAGPAFNDLIPGRVDVMFNNTGAVLPLIAGDKLRGLAVTSAKRTPLAPQFPPIAEEGVPGFDVTSWYGILRAGEDPAGDRAQDERRRRRGDPRSRHQVRGSISSASPRIGSTPAELGAFLKREMDKWGPVIKEAGITGTAAN